MSNKMGVRKRWKLQLPGLTKTVDIPEKHWGAAEERLWKTLWKLWITFCIGNYATDYVTEKWRGKSRESLDIWWGRGGASLPCRWRKYKGYREKWGKTGENVS